LTDPPGATGPKIDWLRKRPVGDAGEQNAKPRIRIPVFKKNSKKQPLRKNFGPFACLMNSNNPEGGGPISRNPFFRAEDGGQKQKKKTPTGSCLSVARKLEPRWFCRFDNGFGDKRGRSPGWEEVGESWRRRPDGGCLPVLLGGLPTWRTNWHHLVIDNGRKLRP